MTSHTNIRRDVIPHYTACWTSFHGACHLRDDLIPLKSVETYPLERHDHCFQA